MQDTSPEYVKYKDVGCELHSACLTCPLVVCKEELTMGIQDVRAHMRKLQIQLLRDEGHPVRWIADVMGITARGVYKSLAHISELDVLTDSIKRDTVELRASYV